MSPATAVEIRERRGLLRRVLVPVAALLVLVAAINGLLISRVAMTLDEKAATAQSLSVASVLKRQRIKLETTVGDYTWWDDFYAALGTPAFAAWSQINLDQPLPGAFEASAAWVISEKGEMLYSWSSDDGDAARRFAGAPALEAVRRAALQQPDVDAPHAISTFAVIEGRLYIVAAAFVAPTDPALRAGPRRHDVLIVVSDVAATAYPKLAEDFGLTGLRFDTAPPAEEGAPAARFDGLDGAPVGYLTWTIGGQLAAFWASYWPGGLALVLGIAAALALLALRWRALIAHFTSVSLAAKAAEQASAAKSAFIANMSHELRTPLNAIIGFSEIMQQELYGPHSQPQYRDYAGDIHSSGAHLLGIINDILSIARIEAGEHCLKIEPCDLVEVAGEALRMIGGAAEKAGVALHAPRDRAAIMVLADHKALRQIILNLLSNAVKFTPRGGRVSLAWSEKRLDRSVEIVVADTGIGIPRDKLPMLGTPFFQVADVQARQTGGTGLGLSIVAGFIGAMDGAFSIDSEFGKGTTVTLRLPSAKRPPRVLEAA